MTQNHKMEVLGQTALLDLLPVDVLPPLCFISREMYKICSAYLQERIRKELKYPDIELNPENPVSDFIRLMSLEEDFVTRGSEEFIGLDEALYRAAKGDRFMRETSGGGSRKLINYLLRISPEAEEGCESKHVRLLALASLLEGRHDMAEEIWSECDYADSSSILDIIKEQRVETGVLTRRLHHLEKELIHYPEFYPFSYDSVSLLKRIIESRLIFGSDIQWILLGASREGNLNVIRYIVDRYRPMSDLQSALNEAAGSGKLNVIKYILRIDSDLNLSSAISEAAGSGKLNVIEYLTEVNPELDLQNPLRVAIWSGHLDVVKHLIKNSELNLQEGLEEAVYYKKLDMIRYFVETYPDLNLQKALDNMTYMDLSTINYLTTLDPNLLLRHILMKSVIREGHPSILYHVIRTNPEYNPKMAFEDVLIYNKPNIAIDLIERYPNLISQESLNIATKYGIPEVIKYLVEYPELNPGEALSWSRSRSTSKYIRDIIRERLGRSGKRSCRDRTARPS